MVPAACSLTEDELQAQIQRYRTVGQSAHTKRRVGMSIELGLGPQVSNELIEELVATERRCCPFFRLDWRPDERELVVAVASVEHRPALEQIASALAIP